MTDHDSATWIDSVDYSAWLLREAPDGLLPVISASTSLETGVNSPYIKLIHEAVDFSAVWAIGNDMICKSRFTDLGVTAESVILDYVRNQQPSIFFVPEVLRQIFTDDRYFLLLKRLPGRTLDDAWLSLDESSKNHYVSSIVDACIEMARWKGLKVGGVDGQLVPEYYLAGDDEDFNIVGQSCEKLGMDYSNPVFYYADLGPTNIIVEDKPVGGKIGIIDFECAGFFPKGWIRTKFRVGGGLNLTTTSDEGATEWRSLVQRALEAKGFEDHAQAFAEHEM